LCLVAAAGDGRVSKSWGIGRSGARGDVWNCRSCLCRVPNTAAVPRLRLSQVTRQLEVSTDCEMAIAHGSETIVICTESQLC